MNLIDRPGHPPVDILIAEDSPTQSLRLCHILEDAGYHITGTTNGREALASAQSKRPTLIISDVVMPEMDGYELCRRVKADPALHDVPIILVTTLSDPQDVIRGLECRADNFILKPYDEHYLLSRVQFVLLNREMRLSEQGAMGVEIYFNGHKHFITADRLQILNLLLSTYEAAIQRNKELSQAQGDLRRLNSNLESANKELEAFSYSVSHDLRGPLRSVDGYANILRQKFGTLIPAEGLRLLDNVIGGAKRMGQLIDDLLKLSRLGRQYLSKRPVDLKALVQEVVREVRDGQPEQKPVQVIIGDLPGCIADPSLLKQVLLNLVANAFKFSRGKEAPVVEVNFKAEDGAVVYFVRDNGAGFDMQYAANLFGVFQRLHRADEFEGTGVGLSIVHRIVSRHGGQVWAEAAVGQGATFFFTLPQGEEA